MWHIMLLRYNGCDTPCDYNVKFVTPYVIPQNVCETSCDYNVMDAIHPVITL